MTVEIQEVAAAPQVAPMATALYRFYDSQRRLLYVGITMNPAIRWKGHSKERPWWRQVRHATIDHYDSREAALEAEAQAIRSESPRWNLTHRPRALVETGEMDLDKLGRRHRRLRKELTEIQDKLAEAIRAEHANGATVYELLHRSGYGSLETIRQIVNPDRREELNRQRKVKRDKRKTREGRK